MADYKDGYSNASQNYVGNVVTSNDVDRERYSRSKAREELYNDNWRKQMVNINDIVNQFVPNSTGYSKGPKYIFENENYTIKADMSAGYLRIYDKKRKRYVKLDRTPGSNEETHFKIKKRSEM